MAKQMPWIVDRDETAISAAAASVFDGRGEWVADFVTTAFANEAVNARNALAGRDPKLLEALVDACIVLRETEQAGLDVAAVLVVFALNDFLGEGDECRIEQSIAFDGDAYCSTHDCHPSRCREGDES